MTTKEVVLREIELHREWLLKNLGIIGDMPEQGEKPTEAEMKSVRNAVMEQQEMNLQSKRI